MEFLIIYCSSFLILNIIALILKTSDYMKNSSEKSTGKYIKIGKIKATLYFLEILALIIFFTTYYINYSKWTSIPLYLLIYLCFSTIFLQIYIMFIERVCKISIEEHFVYIYSKILYFFSKKRKAKEIMQKFLKNNNSYIIRVTLGKMYLKEGGLRKAIEEYIQAVKLKHDDFESMLKIISLLKELNRDNDAIEILLELIDITDDFYEAYIELGQLLEKKGQYKEAIKVYTQGLNIFPTIEIKKKLVRLDIRENNFLEAKKLIEEILLEDNSLDEYSLKLAQICLIYKEIPEAIKILNELIKKNEYAPLAYFELAKIKLFSYDKKEAINYLNKGISIYPRLMQMIEKVDVFHDIIGELVVVLNPKEEVIIKDEILEDFNILSNITSLVQNIEFNTKVEKIREKIQEYIKENEEQEEKNEDQSVENEEKNIKKERKLILEVKNGETIMSYED